MTSALCASSASMSSANRLFSRSLGIVSHHMPCRAGRQYFPESPDGLVQVALDRSLGAIQHPGRTRRRVTQQPSQGHHLPLTIRQRGDRLVQSTGEVGQPAGVDATRGHRFQDRGIIDRMRAPAPRLAAHSNGEPTHPSGPFDLLSSPGTGLPGPQQGFLSRLGRVRLVTKQRQAQAVRLCGQRLEVRLLIAVGRAQSSIPVTCPFMTSAASRFTAARHIIARY